MTSSESAAEYAQRLAARQQSAALLGRRHFRMGNLRLAVFVLLAGLVFMMIRNGRPSAWWLLAGFVAFLVLGIRHNRIQDDMEKAGRAVKWYRQGQARMEDRWTGTGDTGQEFRAPDHVYADDLDLFGDGSLFQLLCVARSRIGKECLARRLQWPGASPERIAQIEAWQAAVAELKMKPDLREAVFTAGENETINADGPGLKQWAATVVSLEYRRWWPWALLLAALNAATFIYAARSFMLTGSAFWTPFILLLVTNGVIMYRLRKRMETLMAGLDKASHNLKSIADVLELIEGHKFDAPLLRSLHAELLTGELPASRAIEALGTLCDLEDSRHNMVVRLIDLPLLYTLHLGFALQRWRLRHSAHIATWLDTLGEFETLISLATYAYEHPEDPFPEFLSPGAPAELQVKDIGHPLLSGAACVRNSLSLGGASRILLVSGSNMSGKSTLLRAVGVNTLLATIGAPVRATFMRLPALSVGASIHVSDSLRKGVSHFYAEISRIRQVVDLSKQGPALFLFDEILQGTNSHDRRAGAQGIVNTLLKNGAIGLITTHDLSLTALEEAFPGHIANVHFQEKFEAGKLSFDYRLRPGVVTTSNGVELMKSVGLDV